MDHIPTPPTGGSFKSWSEALSFLWDFAKGHGFAVIKQRATMDRGGDLKQIYIRCDRGGAYHGPSSKQPSRSTRSRLTDCPFSAVIAKSKNSGLWSLLIRIPEHNHGPSSSSQAHVQYRREDMNKLRPFILQQLEDRIKPNQILATARQKYPNTAIHIRDIYNLREKKKKVELMCKLAYDYENKAKDQDLLLPWMEADQKCQQALDSCEKNLGLNHPLTQDMANFRERLLASKNKSMEGATPHRQAPNNGKIIASHGLLDRQDTMEECWEPYLAKLKTKDMEECWKAYFATKKIKDAKGPYSLPSGRLTPLISEISPETALQLLCNNLEKLKERFAKSPNMSGYSENMNWWFLSIEVPLITLKDYIQRLHQYCPMSTAIFLATSSYIANIALSKKVLSVTSRNIHRLVLAGLWVAAKASEELIYPQSRFAKVGGVSEKELFELERVFCHLAKFELFVDVQMLMEEARRHSTSGSETLESAGPGRSGSFPESPFELPPSLEQQWSADDSWLFFNPPSDPIFGPPSGDIEDTSQTDTAGLTY